jgi:hypothetical protein
MKELPYFKFNCSEWMHGDITLEDFQVQGVFINICAYYWFKSGCLKTSEIKPRLKCKQATIDLLLENGHLKEVFAGENGTESFIKISFLDQQFAERGHISKINSENAKKGGAPKGNSNAKKQENNNQSVELKQPKTTNIEEEKNKKENREERERETRAPKDLNWFKKNLNEMLLDQLPSDKKKNLGRAIEESFLFLASDPVRLSMADSKECMQLLMKWLSNMKTEPNGKSKVLHTLD